MRNKILSINITTSTIIKTIIILFGLWLLFYLRNIVGVFFVSLLLTAALRPLIDWLEKKKMPRGLGIAFVYIILFALISISLILMIPPIARESKLLLENLPAYWQKLIGGFAVIKEFSITHGWLNNINEVINSLQNNLTLFTANLFSAVSSIFGGVVSFIFILVITFYMTLEKNAEERIVNLLVPDKYKKSILKLLKKLEDKIGLWARGQIVLMLIIGFLAFIGLYLLGINYALTLGLFAGITELIPYLGPVLGAIPAVFIAFIQSPYKALAVIIFYFIIQEIENNILVPKVMERAVGLNPIISIFAILIGAKLAGILGVLLSIPVATSLIVIIKEFYQKEKIE